MKAKLIAFSKAFLFVAFIFAALFLITWFQLNAAEPPTPVDSTLYVTKVGNDVVLKWTSETKVVPVKALDPQFFKTLPLVCLSPSTSTDGTCVDVGAVKDGNSLVFYKLDAPKPARNGG